MRIKSILALSLATPLIVGLLSISTPAFADTLTFGSYVGTTATAGFANTGGISFNSAVSGTSGSSVSTLYGDIFDKLPTAIGTASYISYTSLGGAAPIGDTTYSFTYTGNLAGDTGSISFEGDDITTASLNGNLIGTESSYNTVDTIAINPSFYTDGTNTFTFVVDNTGGFTGVDFEATAVSAAPEPSSLILLGTGILGLAGAARRRLLA